MSSSSSYSGIYNNNLSEFEPFNRRVGDTLFVYLEDGRSTRNFEEFITERGDLTFDRTVGQFNDVFSSLKNNLFQLSETENIEFTEKDRKKINSKYCLDQVTNIIDILKSNIITLNNKKIEIDQLYYVNKEKYEKFSESIFASINTIEQINKIN